MKAILLGAFGMLVSMALVFMAANAKDEPLNPSTLELLQLKYEPTLTRAAAFKYLLGITASLDKSPIDAGEEFFKNTMIAIEENNINLATTYPKAILPEVPDVCKDSPDCTPQEITENSAAIKNFLTQAEPFLRRFDQLLSYEKIANQFPPHILTTLRNIFPLYTLTNLKLLQLKYRAYALKDPDVKVELVKIYHFFSSFLESPDSLVATVIKVSILRNTKNLYTELKHLHLNQNPNQNSEDSLTLTIAKEKILNDIVYYELKVFESFLNLNLGSIANTINTQSLDLGNTETSTTNSLINLFSPFLLQKNRTLNTRHDLLIQARDAEVLPNGECVESVFPESKFAYIRNPAGINLNVIFSSNAFCSMAKLKASIENLQRAP